MARTFKQMIENIRKSDEQLMAAVVEACAYTMHQYHANNRKVDGAGANLAEQLINAVPVWLRDACKGLQQGKRDVNLTLEKATDMAACHVTGFFREQQQKREQARIKRAQKKAEKPVSAEKPSAVEVNTPEKVIDSEVVEVESALIVGGEVLTLSAEEAQMLKDGLLAMRMKLAIAA